MLYLDYLYQIFFSLILQFEAPIYALNDPINLTCWQGTVELYNHDFFIKRLGWDPKINLYKDPNAHLVMNDSCTVYCHGWGESQSAIIEKQSWGILPGTIVGFNFSDAVEEERDILSVLHKSSFAQTQDCAALIAVLKLLDEAQCTTIHLVGYSRGGGTVANSIRRLKNYKEYKKFFNKLGISQRQAESIITRIKKGTIVLDCPLVDMRVIVKYRFPTMYNFFNYVLIPMVTFGNYTPSKDHAIEAAAFLSDFALLVHFQYRDRIVTNICDQDFYQAVSSPTTHVILGNDGGHFHKGQTLSFALNAFRQKYAGPYYNNEYLLDRGAILMARSQPEHHHLKDYFYNDLFFNREKTT